jgi:hypothetical protein
MGAQIKSDFPIKAVVSVAQMCRLLHMSRSQFYWHVKRGTFHAPQYLASNKRPYFTASMVEDNLRVRETGIGVNGEYVIFYERQSVEPKPSERKIKASHASLIDGLKALGLSGVTSEQVESALAVVFPKGITGQDDAAILRAVFRQLKRSGTG